MKRKKLTKLEVSKIKKRMAKQPVKKDYLAQFGLLHQQIDYPVRAGSCSVALYNKLKVAFDL